MKMLTEFVYLRCEKAIETLKYYNSVTCDCDNIYDVKRFLGTLVNQFQNSYKEKDVNTIENISLKRIIDLSITLEVLDSLPEEVFTIEQIFHELEIRKNLEIHNRLKLNKKFKKELE